MGDFAFFDRIPFTFIAAKPSPSKPKPKILEGSGTVCGGCAADFIARRSNTIKSAPLPAAIPIELIVSPASASILR